MFSGVELRLWTILYPTRHCDHPERERMALKKQVVFLYIANELTVLFSPLGHVE